MMTSKEPTLNDEFFHLRLFLRYKYYYAMERFTSYWDHGIYEVAILHLMHSLKAFEAEKNTINFMEGNCVELENMYNDLKLYIDKFLKLYNVEEEMEKKSLTCPNDCKFCYYKTILYDDENDTDLENDFLQKDEIYDIPLLTVYNCAKQIKKINEEKEEFPKQKVVYNENSIFKKFKNIFNK
uniref:Uncharacterized protein n=1 Tax=Strongyloides papillosus TaxID=174720 RepID=A0A0N5B3Q2_STREA